MFSMATPIHPQIFILYFTLFCFILFYFMFEYYPREIDFSNLYYNRFQNTTLRTFIVPGEIHCSNLYYN